MTLVRRLVEIVLGDLEMSFQPLSPVSFGIDRIETNPRFGPLAFQTLQQFYGSGAPTSVIIADHHFTQDNAKQALANGDVY